MPVGVVVTGNLLVVPGRHFFLRHFPAARCHLNVVRAHLTCAHKSLLEHRSDHVSDTPERKQTISRLSECGNRLKPTLRGCYMAPAARSQFAVNSDGLVTKLRLKSPSKTEPWRSERTLVSIARTSALEDVWL